MDTKKEFVICMGSSCFARGNKTNVEFIQKYLKDRNLLDKVQFKGQLCTGNCNEGPMIQIDGVQYSQIDEKKLTAILTDLFEK